MTRKILKKVIKNKCSCLSLVPVDLVVAAAAAAAVDPT